MASGWSFLAGFADSLGGSLQAREAQKEKERLAKLEEDALMKRQMFLAEYKASIDEKNSQAEYERTKNDVTAQFTDPETGSVYGRTKGGGIVPLHETSEEYRQSLRDKTASDIEYKKAQRESAEARAERARRPSVPRAKKEPKPPKPETTSFKLAGDEGRIKVRPADSIGPAAPMNIRPALEQMPSRDEDAEVTPVFVEPNGGVPVQKGPAAKPSREEIMAKAQAAIAAGADPAKVEARVMQLLQQFGYVQ